MAWIFFVPCVLVSSFIVMNVVVGIVVNSISEVTAEKADAKKPEDESGDLSAELDALKEHIAKIERLIETKK